MQYIGIYAVPIIITAVSLAILISKKNLFDEFAKGCRDGFITALKILPTLIILIVAVKMFSASGALELLCNFVGKFTEIIGIPKGVIPVILTRPVSGSAATAMISNLFSEYGPDSFEGRLASVIMGSTDTIIYTLAMYFGAVGVTRSKYALPAAFLLFAFCIFTAYTVTKVFFTV
jgi:spore maturation protein B